MLNENDERYASVRAMLTLAMTIMKHDRQMGTEWLWATRSRRRSSVSTSRSWTWTRTTCSPTDCIRSCVRVYSHARDGLTCR